MLTLSLTACPLPNYPRSDWTLEKKQFSDLEVFWASQIQIRVYLYGSGSRSFHHQAKIFLKNFEFCDFFVTFYLRNLM
jgi:hypothetical protein